MSGRKTFKQLLSEKQLDMLENYFIKVNQLPKRKDKLQLAKESGVDPFVLNRWFQARRNKDKIALRKLNRKKNGNQQVKNHEIR